MQMSGFLSSSRDGAQARLSRNLERPGSRYVLNTLLRTTLAATRVKSRVRTCLSFFPSLNEFHFVSRYKHSEWARMNAQYIMYRICQERDAPLSRV